MLNEFDGEVSDSFDISGDVKYHLGYSMIIKPLAVIILGLRWPLTLLILKLEPSSVRKDSRSTR